MAKPLVALVGRPNVGKSTLFNRLVGERRAIVFDEPGTTRDRTYGEADWNGLTFDVVDTGGLQSEDEIARSSLAEIARGTREQARLAIDEADAIVFLVDGQDGLLPSDEEVADLLRRSDKPVIVGVNKAESAARREDAVEFYALGLGEPTPFSAYHGTGTGDLLDRIVAALPPAVEEEEEEAPKIAIVGRPNVGKSALLNALLGQPRAIVSAVPGTTRDPLDTPLIWEGQPLTLIDTAGIRRRGRVEHGGVEQYSVIRSMKAISRCDVALLLIDAVEGITAQDLHIAGYIADEAKGIVVVVNKWDAVEKDTDTMDEFREEIGQALDFMSYAPLVFISALHGQRVARVPELALEVLAERDKRVPTGQLNRVVREAVTAHPAPGKQGRPLRFYYATQPRVAPPTFVFFVSDPKMIHFGYRRYLENRLREEFGFIGTPIRLSFRGRGEE
ncbi:MAG TPA: ribosome biogenesis GTPase Der [Thermomicrobiales bacterium]|nr:ribosome biogenesis GTPase Der [Thermomicrobiales bacterium]